MGEERLIRAIRRWLGTAAPAAPHGMGDDCAVLPRLAGRPLLTVDPVIYGEHFDDRVPARAAGAKLLKRNLSDIAAMGGRARAATVALALDPRTKRSWLEGFYRGLAAEARRQRVAIVGGDVARLAGGLVATLTLLGETTGARALTRKGAKAGDFIFVTGRLGGSLASGHHHRFAPRMREGAWLARRQEVRAMIDVSDGMAKDLPAITPTGAEPAVDAGALPRRNGCDVRAVLCDGEDYELLFAVAGRADLDALRRAWRRAFPRTELSCVGRFVRRGQRPAGAIDPGLYRGFEHLIGR
jgi:thiamine-monophosphate kinase